MSEHKINERERAVPEPAKRIVRDGSVPQTQQPPPVLGLPTVDAGAALADAVEGVAIDQAALIKEHIEAIEAETGRAFVRESFGERGLKLSAPPRPGFHRHWANEDDRGRIDDMKRGGYKIVKDDHGRPLSRIVGRSAKGDGQRAYLMEIPVQWWLQDMAERQRVANQMDENIRRNEIAVNGLDGKLRYVPKEGIQITSESMGSPLSPKQ